MATITHTDYLLSSGVSGLWVRLRNNSTSTDYYAAAITDALGAFTHSAPPGDYSLYWGTAATVPGTPNLRSSHYAVPVTAGDDIAAGSVSAVASSPYVPSGLPGGGDFQAAVRFKNGPWKDLTHPAYGAKNDGATDLGAIINALAAGGTYLLPATDGTNSAHYKLSTAATIPINTTLIVLPGAIIDITVVGGAEAIAGNLASSIVGWGIGNGMPEVHTLSGANVASVFSNLVKDGTQEYFRLEGFNIINDTGSTIVTATVNLVSLYVNSGVRNVVINCNHVSPLGFRIAGGTSGYGPIYLEDCWSLYSAGDGVLVVDNGLSASTAQLLRVTSEHWASGFHGLHIKTGGTLIQVTVRDYHAENATVAGAASAHIYLEGAPDCLIDGAQFYAQTLANKKGVWISNTATNVRIRATAITNNNLINPIVQDDLNGITYGAIPAHPQYYTPDVGLYFRQRQTLAQTGGGTKTIDVSLGSDVEIDVNDATAWTLGAPSNWGLNQVVTLEIVNGTGGAIGVITWNAVFTYRDASYANPATGKRRTIQFLKRTAGSAAQMGAATADM